jgi:hypothetical protein
MAAVANDNAGACPPQMLLVVEYPATYPVLHWNMYGLWIVVYESIY